MKNIAASPIQCKDKNTLRQIYFKGIFQQMFDQIIFHIKEVP